ncbi:MAG: response regulator [Firmicutes bacterium]|jgi:signal transduction histidine kinase|nr:response regulator [Bacillota bacterium]
MDKLKILIVDDSKLIVEYSKKIILDNNLTDHIDYVSSGLEALKILENQEYDLILLDVVMPEMTGLEVLEILNSRGDIRSYSIIVFTSSDDNEIIKKSFDLGARDFIKKPFRETELISRIKNIINGEKLKKELKEKIWDIENKNKELISLNKKLNDAQTQIIQKEKMAGVGNLAAGIAHEINNPLGFVSSNIEVLSDYYNIFGNIMNMIRSIRAKDNSDKNDIWEELDSYMDRVNIDFIKSDIKELFLDTSEGIDRIIAIINALRTFSSVDTIENYYSYDINDGINKTLIVSTNMHSRVAKINAVLNAKSEVMAMGGLINQVILSLLSNSIESIKACSDKRSGLIDINTEEDNFNIYFSIKDNGGGINKDNIPSVFNPFYTTKEIGEGVGFGLTIAYDVIVNKHDGKIWIDSEEDVFTKVSFVLPKESNKDGHNFK